MAGQRRQIGSSIVAALLAVVCGLGGTFLVLGIVDTATSLYDKFRERLLPVVFFALLFGAVGPLVHRALKRDIGRAGVLTLGAMGLVGFGGLVVTLVLAQSSAPQARSALPELREGSPATVSQPSSAGVSHSSQAPAQGVGCFRAGQQVACDTDHDAEVVDGIRCDRDGLVQHMGGQAGVDQLADTVQAKQEADGTCRVQFANPASVPLKGALSSPESAQFRACFDRNGQGVTCDQPHIAELTQRAPQSEAIDCRTAATRYLGVEATVHEGELAWPEYAGSADSRMCAVQVRNANVACLSGSLRNVGHTKIRLTHC